MFLSALYDFVGTLKQGYPCYKEKALCQVSGCAVNGPLSCNINRLGGRHGKGGAPDVCSGPGPAAWKAPDPVHSVRTSGTNPGPFQAWFGRFTTGSQILGAGNTRTLPWKGSGADTCPGLAPPPPPAKAETRYYHMACGP
jgi:hypothetical protein